MPSTERIAVAVPICVMLTVLLKVEGGMFGIMTGDDMNSFNDGLGDE